MMSFFRFSIGPEVLRDVLRDERSKAMHERDEEPKPQAAHIAALAAPRLKTRHLQTRTLATENEHLGRAVADIESSKLILAGIAGVLLRHDALDMNSGPRNGGSRTAPTEPCEMIADVQLRHAMVIELLESAQRHIENRQTPAPFPASGRSFTPSRGRIRDGLEENRDAVAAFERE
jgi:hypothetical protein